MLQSSKMIYSIIWIQKSSDFFLNLLWFFKGFRHLTFPIQYKEDVNLDLLFRWLCDWKLCFLHETRCIVYILFFSSFSFVSRALYCFSTLFNCSNIVCTFVRNSSSELWFKIAAYAVGVLSRQRHKILMSPSNLLRKPHHTDLMKQEIYVETITMYKTLNMTIIWCCLCVRVWHSKYTQIYRMTCTSIECCSWFWNKDQKRTLNIYDLISFSFLFCSFRFVLQVFVCCQPLETNCQLFVCVSASVWMNFVCNADCKTLE